GVGEPVHALAAARVGAVRDDGEHVVGGQVRDRDPVFVERLERDVGAVQRDARDGGGGQVDERGAAWLVAREPDHAPRGERRIAAGQIQVYLVRRYLDERGALAGFIPGQVR